MTKKIMILLIAVVVMTVGVWRGSHAHFVSN